MTRATEYAGEEADIGLRLWMILKPRLAAVSVTTVYETLERPLAPVLAEMERRGVKVEQATLASLSLSFAQTIARLEDEIRELAGEDFNIGSPKQLGEILFDKMSLPGGGAPRRGPGAPTPRRSRSWRPKATICRARCSIGACSPS